MSEKALREGIKNAMGSILGCGGPPDEGQIEAIKKTVQPMWNTMPKTNGQIDRRSLRYIVHRYFIQTSSLMIRGFEPSRPTNDSHWGSADVLSQMVPAYVESVLESKHKTEAGFTLQDVVDMVLTIDQLIFDSESAVLEKVYQNQNRPITTSLSLKGVKQVLEEYMITWMVDADPEDIVLLLENQTLAAQVLPHYEALLKFAEGRVSALDFQRYQNMPKGRGKDAFAARYSFDETHQVIGGITRSFQSFWQSECDSMKEALVSMDKHNTGRVPLSMFYNTAINTDWRFGESESYLRELGALDETSSWRGSQVIIPNYLQSTSNCIVSSPHYLICCVNECESLLGELEIAIGSPTALPSTIISLVRNMTAQQSIDDDGAPHLDQHILSQLDKVAENHNGRVPLHGRLFAQWLHYVFPRECPFPYKQGAVTTATPSEYGDEFIASKEDMTKHASTASDVNMSVGKEELQWMSQWSEDEELMVDYQNELSRPWGWHIIFYLATAILAASGIYSGVLGKSQTKSFTGGPLPTHKHSHWV